MREYFADLSLDGHASHISKELVDQVASCLIGQYPDRLDAVLRYERGHTDASTIKAYGEAAYQAFAHVTNEGKDIQDPHLACIEVTFELIRRCRSAAGYKLPQVLGKPLAPSIDGPYPAHLKYTKISDYLLSRGHGQDVVDGWIDEYYAENKATCYRKGEAFRREVYSTNFQTGISSKAYFHQKLEDPNDSKSWMLVHDVNNHLGESIRLTCDIVYEV